MHNGTVQQGDTWLQNNIDAYAQWAKANNSLLVVTWDEGSSEDHVPAILVGARITPGSTNGTAYNHYNMLSTVLAASNLKGPNNAASAAPIALSTTPTPPPPPTNDTLVLHLSEDAWKGDAKFVVSVDGAHVGATQVVTASHALGQSETFSFQGSWGSGHHDIGVTFVNDAWGGTPSTDRNLYVGSVAFDGVTHPNTSAALYWDRTAHFTV